MNKNDWTPEELRLKEALNKIYETDTRKPSRPLDLSFMNQPPKKKSHKRLGFIAAIIAVMVISSVSTAIFISNDYVSAVQDKIQKKVFEMKHGVVVATDEEFSEEGETVWEITDFETAKKAKELIPELPIPGYMPEGYEFEKLTLHTYDNADYYAEYQYTLETNALHIICFTTDSELIASSNNIIDTIYLNDATIFIWEDSMINAKGATVISNNSTIQISTVAPISNDDLSQICLCIQK